MSEIQPVTPVAIQRTPSNEEVAFGLLQRQAQALAGSTLVPKEYVNNVSNCMIAVDLANRLRLSAMMIVQNLHIVHGRPGWSASFIAAQINTCGLFRPLKYVMVGTQGKPDWGCYATAVTIPDGEVVEGPTVTMAMANAEGWTQKAGSKWKTMPEVMLRYRATSFFGKIYASARLMGLQSSEEAYDMGPPIVEAQANPFQAVEEPPPARKTEPPPAIEAEAETEEDPDSDYDGPPDDYVSEQGAKA